MTTDDERSPTTGATPQTKTQSSVVRRPSSIQPMRVLFISHYFPPDYTGGAEVSLFHTYRGLVERGLVCTVLSVNHRAAQAVNEWYEIDGVQVHRVRFGTRWPGGQLLDPRVLRAVRREIRDLCPDIVHVHNVFDASLAPFVACRLEGVPVVNTLHDLWLTCPNNMRYRADGSFCDPKKFPRGCGNCFRDNVYWAAVPFRHQIFRALTANVARFLPPSQAVLERHVESGYRRERFQRLRLGFADAPAAPPASPAVARITGEAGRRPTLVFAGGGIQIKGAEVLLRALPDLLARVPDLQVIVAGGGDGDLKAAMARTSTAVQVIGPVPFHEMRALFAAADLVLYASVWHENSPVVTFEAFQVGTPLVASAIGGLPEFIREDETGYLFPPGDAHALVDKVAAHFAKPPRERRAMRQRCARIVRTTLSLAQHLDALEAVYGEVLEERGA